MENQYFKIKPFSGKILGDYDPKVKIDPYLLIKYNNETYFTAISKNTGKFPYWTDTFVFRKTNDSKIYIQCWDYNIENKENCDSIIGEGIYEITNGKKSLSWISLNRGNNEKKEKVFELLIEIENFTKEKNSNKIEEKNKHVVHQPILEEINNNQHYSNYGNRLPNGNKFDNRRNIIQREKTPDSHSINKGNVLINGNVIRTPIGRSYTYVNQLPRKNISIGSNPVIVNNFQQQPPPVIYYQNPNSYHPPM